MIFLQMILTTDISVISSFGNKKKYELHLMELQRERHEE